MPGIAGILGSRSMEEGALTVRRMTSTMLHESSYTSGVCVDEGLRACVGWVSHRDSFADCMPVWNERRDICLIFTGEEFTEVDRLQQLKDRGHSFDAHNATYLIHQYEAEGLAFLERLNGWFTGVVIDRRERRAVLFNDRFGLQRLYYNEAPTGFYFASEAKALLKVLPNLRQVDPLALAENFSFGCVLRNQTLFPKVALLPGASVWTFSPERTKKGRYFEVSTWEEQSPLDEAQYCRSPAGGVHPRASKVPSTGPAVGHVTDSRFRRPHDHGVGQVATWYVALLHVRE